MWQIASQWSVKYEGDLVHHKTKEVFKVKLEVQSVQFSASLMMI
jgi:hypothetical protein